MIEYTRKLVSTLLGDHFCNIYPNQIAYWHEILAAQLCVLHAYSQYVMNM